MTRRGIFTILLIGMALLAACRPQTVPGPAEPATPTSGAQGAAATPDQAHSAATEAPSNTMNLPVVPVDQGAGEAAAGEAAEGNTLVLPVLPVSGDGVGQDSEAGGGKQPGGGDQPGDVMPADPDTPALPPLVDLQAQPGDQALQTGKVFLDGARVLLVDAPDAPISVLVEGNLPSPCHQLRADVSEQDAQGRILVDVYSVIDPNQMCAQVLQPFTVRVPLPVQDPSQMTVLLNGKEVGLR